MSLTQVLNNTNGRFTTLVVNTNRENTSYCARIISATANTVSFYDINANKTRRVSAKSVKFAKSGKLQYRNA
jgi:hypothetical protein